MKKRDAMRIALCIVGAMRSMPMPQFRQGLEAFVRELRSGSAQCDVFLALCTRDQDRRGCLLNSEAAVENIVRVLDSVRPISRAVFYEETAEVEPRVRHTSQVQAIAEAIRMACEHRYGKEAPSYDYYIRYRPDFVMLRSGLDLTAISSDTVYTTRKFDAKASDQVFMFSEKMRREWWSKVSGLEMFCPPEYRIFRSEYIDRKRIRNGPLFFGGLLRTDEDDLDTWDPSPERPKGRAKLPEAAPSEAPLLMATSPKRFSMLPRFRELLRQRIRDRGHTCVEFRRYLLLPQRT